LVTASFVTPPFLGAVAWESLAAPNSGILNQLCRNLFGLGDYEHVFYIYSSAGIVFTMACYSFPYVFVLVANALDNIPAELEQASAILGGSSWATLRRVTIPLVLPALLAGGLVAFIQSLTQFGVPAILAPPAGFHVIYDENLVAVSKLRRAASRRSGGDAAAAPDHPVAARSAVAAGAARL
jgi:iron(III) transport system permease protein